MKRDYFRIDMQTLCTALFQCIQVLGADFPAEKYDVIVYSDKISIVSKNELG